VSGAVSLDISGAVAFVTLSHPGKFNAMSRAMWRELRAVFESVQQDCALRAALVRGEGGHFCAGGDISEYAAFALTKPACATFTSAKCGAVCRPCWRATCPSWP
jgi:enoyl-CoA hydratase/carnithine racemase